jgi:hypothetical protein
MHPAQKASGSAAFVTRGEKFIDLDPAGPLSQTSNGVHRLIDLLLLSIEFRHDASDGAPMPSNNQSLTPLDFVEQSGQMSFRLGGLNLTHI